MKEIGENKMITVRAKDPKTGKVTVVVGPDQQPEKRMVKDVVERVTHEPLGHGFGSDRRRRLVVRLEATDTIVFKPHKCSSKRAVRASLRDMYRYVIWCEAQRKQLQKAREKKARLAERRAQRRLDAAERRLRESARNGV